MLDLLRNVFRPKYCDIHSKTDIYCLNTCIKVVDRLQLMTTRTKQSLPSLPSSFLTALCTFSPRLPPDQAPDANTLLVSARSNTAPTSLL